MSNTSFKPFRPERPALTASDADDHSVFLPLSQASSAFRTTHRPNAISVTLPRAFISNISLLSELAA